MEDASVAVLAVGWPAELSHPPSPTDSPEARIAYMQCFLNHLMAQHQTFEALINDPNAIALLAVRLGEDVEVKDVLRESNTRNKNLQVSFDSTREYLKIDEIETPDEDDATRESRSLIRGGGRETDE